MCKRVLPFFFALVGCGGGSQTIDFINPGSFRATLSEVKGANTRSTPLDAVSMVGVLMPDSGGGFAAFESEHLKDSRSISVEVPHTPQAGEVLALVPDLKRAPATGGPCATVQYWDNTLYEASATERFWASRHGSLRIDAVEMRERSILLDVTILDAWMETGATPTTATAGPATGTFWLTGEGRRIELNFLQLN